jgi:hypothetical protein
VSESAPEQRQWCIEDATPEDMAALDCSSAESATDGFADDNALNGVENEDLSA